MRDPVELIYDADCPNAAAARAELSHALKRSGRPGRWVEWDRSDPSAPDRIRAFGSPTVLVAGRDVAGASGSAPMACCRLYPVEGGGFRGAPAADAIERALGEGGRCPGGWRSSLASVPGLLLSALPVAACPACWPAYGGLIGALGLGFLFRAEWLLPLSVLFLGLALAGFVVGGRRGRGWGPFFLGSGAVALVLAGKFWMLSEAMLYTGLGLWVAAAVWNAWPRSGVSGTCGRADFGSLRGISVKRERKEGRS